MKVLVTGASGFLGSWIVRRLIQDGLDVHILARPSSDLSEIDGLKFSLHHGDVTDPQTIVSAVKDADSVFHLAGLIAYTRSERTAMERVNVQGTKNVIDACRMAKVNKLVHLSSVVAIGASFDGRNILNEESEYNLSHLNLGYFETKRKAELEVIGVAKKGDFEAVILNPGTIYGAGDAKKGSRKTQIKVAQGKFPFFPSGGVNVVNVHDVVDAIMAAWQKGGNAERYILGGENLTIKKVFDIIADVAGVTPPKLFLPNTVIHALGKVGDLMEKLGQKGPINSENAWISTLFHWFDSSKAQRELGLKVTPAKDSIRESVEWMKKNGYLDR